MSIQVSLSPSIHHLHLCLNLVAHSWDILNNQSCPQQFTIPNWCQSLLILTLTPTSTFPHTVHSHEGHMSVFDSSSLVPCERHVVYANKILTHPIYHCHKEIDLDKIDTHDIQPQGGQWCALFCKYRSKMASSTAPASFYSDFWSFASKFKFKTLVG